MASIKPDAKCLILLIFVAAAPALAQLAPSEPDPLARIREAAKSNVAACSATGESLCEQVAPKIVANAEGDSPLEDNFRRLNETMRNLTLPSDEPAATWALALFRDAKVEAHVEKYTLRSSQSISAQWDGEDVVAEIRGREKPDEWILLGAQLPEHPGPENAYNAASVIEAARDIQLTGIHPRRSIRFVLFVPGEPAPSHYLQAHHDELDHASAVVILAEGASPITGYALNGRRDIEPGVKQALDPIAAMGATHHTFDAPFNRYSLAFILEGIPTLIAPSPDGGGKHAASTSWAIPIDVQELREIKRNTAIVAVTAFGIAERADALGPRQTRAEIDSLLKSSGLETQMKTAGLWLLWESGERGRMP